MNEKQKPYSLERAEEEASEMRREVENRGAKDYKEAAEKIEISSLIKKKVKEIIELKLVELKEDNFFRSTERIEDLAILKYDLVGFEEFKEKIKPILVKICGEFLKK